MQQKALDAETSYYWKQLYETYYILKWGLHYTVGSSDLQQISPNQVASCGGKLIKAKEWKYKEKIFFHSEVFILFWHCLCVMPKILIFSK
jgi:hypothetical protein